MAILYQVVSAGCPIENIMYKYIVLPQEDIVLVVETIWVCWILNNAVVFT